MVLGCAWEGVGDRITPGVSSKARRARSAASGVAMCSALGVRSTPSPRVMSVMSGPVVAPRVLRPETSQGWRLVTLCSSKRKNEKSVAKKYHIDSCFAPAAVIERAEPTGKFGN